MRKWVFLVASLLISRAWGDVVLLKDGSQFEGSLKRTDTGWTITTADGRVRSIARDAVKSIQVGTSPATRGSQQASDALGSLRRSSEGLSDIAQIIERYQRFIDSMKDDGVLVEAQSDLDLWRQRREQGWVKHGNKWMSPDDLASLTSKAEAAAEVARAFLRENRMREADQLLVQGQSIDPINPSIQYIRGVSFYRQEKLPEARKAFEAANAANPSHPPTLNNLAVIAQRQKQPGVSLNYYDQAMQFSGVNQYILDNVADALGSLPEDQRKGPAYTRCFRRFSELEPILQKQMEPQGLYRWGNSWIDQKKLDELKTAQKESQDRIKSLQADFEKSQQRISQIDSEMAGNQRIIDDLSNNRSMFRDASGSLIAMPLPDSYYELTRKNEQLSAEQESLRQKLASLQGQAGQAQHDMPAPRFTGIQQIVGVEGMPTSNPIASSAPTSKPVDP